MAETIHDAVEELITEAHQRRCRPFSPETSEVFRFEREVTRCDPLLWLCGQGRGERLYWAGRDDHFSVAGVGCADLVSGRCIRDLAAVLAPVPQRTAAGSSYSRYYGGFAFDPDGIRYPWQQFSGIRFILPRIELIEVEKRCFFAWNVFGRELFSQDGYTRLVSEIRSMARQCAGNPGTPHFVERRDYPGRADWIRSAGELIDRIDRGMCEKVVLARMAALRAETEIDPLAVLNRQRRDGVPVFHCMLETDSSTAFVSASPERLYKRVGSRIAAEAIAGTRVLGPGADSFRQAGDALLQSQKDCREHGFVVQELEASLGALCASLRVDPRPEVLSLGTLAHLVTRSNGVLAPGITDAQLITALHPTPAVAGTPTDTALGLIRAAEPFTRGWYCGGVGYLGRDHAEIAVAIRSGLIERETFFVYAGAGLVRGSDPVQEWLETEAKLQSTSGAMYESRSV